MAQSHARLLGHPMHPMLIVFPSSMFPLLLVLSLLFWWLGTPGLWTATFWVAVVGAVTTLAAMVPGIMDMAKIPDDTRAHRTGLTHAVVGTLVLLAYLAAIWARWPVGSGADRFGLAVGIDVLGVLLVTAQGWLGGELVYRHHVGVLPETEGGEPVPLTGKETPAARARREREA